jgi:hypothetical protein
LPSLQSNIISACLAHRDKAAPCEGNHATSALSYPEFAELAEQHHLSLSSPSR